MWGFGFLESDAVSCMSKQRQEVKTIEL